MLSEQPQICKTQSLLCQSMVMSFVSSRNAFSWQGFWFKGAIFALITKLLPEVESNELHLLALL